MRATHIIRESKPIKHYCITVLTLFRMGETGGGGGGGGAKKQPSSSNNISVLLKKLNKKHICYKEQYF